MTLSFPEDIIIGGDGLWHMNLKFHINSFNTPQEKTRQAFFVKETTSSPSATLEFLTNEGPDTWASYSVIL